MAEATGDDALTGLTLRDTVTGDSFALVATGLFIATGHDRRSELVSGQLNLNADGYVAVSHPTIETSLPGVFACGDLVDRRYRQAVTARRNRLRRSPGRRTPSLGPGIGLVRAARRRDVRHDLKYTADWQVHALHCIDNHRYGGGAVATDTRSLTTALKERFPHD